MRPTILPLSKLRRDGDTQVRVELDPATVLHYSELMADGVKLPPVEAFFDGTDYWLSDGFHRVGAYEKLCRVTIPVIVRKGVRQDAAWKALESNKHGLPLTTADRINAVKKALALRPEQSDRQIALHIGVHHSTVSKYRHKAESGGEISHLPKRKGADGKTYDAGSPKADPAPVAEPDVNDIPFDAPQKGEPVPQPGAHSSTDAPKPQTPASGDDDWQDTLPDTGRDFLGNKLSPSVAADFARRAEVNALLVKLGEIKAQIATAVEAKDPMFNFLNWTAFKGEIGMAYRRLAASRPYAVCPWCAGDGCQSCYSHGWVPKTVYGRRPKEL